MKSRLKLAAAALALFPALPVSAQDRSVLPAPRAAFDGTMAENVMDAKPGTDRTLRAPAGAPNVLLFLSDDVGFAMASTFGGPVPTPNFDRLAAQGQRYNRFHTTAICSPTRASLLTGRNHHNAGVGWLSDINTEFPGYNGRIQRDTATIAQTLRLNGWSTAMFGKHHNIPSGERSEAGPFDAWPTGLGFDYYFGFPYGDSDQFSPILYRGTSRIDPAEGRGRMVDEWLADDTIRWVRNQKAAAPDKPFLIYLAPGSAHAPHQAPKEWIARFKGQFDQGWDAVRVETWRRQIAAGIIPRGTKLTPRPAGLPAWDSLPPTERAFHARTMEVAAATLAYQDAQFGRVVAELERMGQAGNTLFAVVMGDNGASGEAGPKGTLNELRTMGTHDERPEWLHDRLDEQGGPRTYQNYSAAWAWAMNAPFPLLKQYASMLGGTRNGLIMNWKGKVARPGAVCARFGHVNDIAPTVLEAVGIPAPKIVLGTEQKPMDGQSLVSSLADCQPDMPRTQYFEIGGKMALYQDGWYLSGDDGRVSWENLPPGGTRPPITWRLYDLTRDFSQSTDLAARHPERLQAMIAAFRAEAEKNNVWPLDHRFAMARAMGSRSASPRKRFDLWGKDISLPTNTDPVLMARPFTLEADLTLDKAGSSGVVLAMGSRFGGWSLWLDQGRPVLTWARSTDPQEIETIRADKALPAGSAKLTMRFATRALGGPAEVVLSSGGEELARGTVSRNFFSPAGNGEMLDTGRDLGVPVTDYPVPGGALEGDIRHIGVTFD